MSFPHGESLTVIPVTRDAHGDETRGTPRRVHGAGVAPRVSTEPGQDRRTAQVVTGLVVYLPPGHGITAADIVIRGLDGTEWRVNGHPGAYRSPLTGWYPGDQIELDRVEG